MERNAVGPAAQRHVVLGTEYDFAGIFFACDPIRGKQDPVDLHQLGKSEKARLIRNIAFCARQILRHRQEIVLRFQFRPVQFKIVFLKRPVLAVRPDKDKMVPEFLQRHVIQPRVHIPFRESEKDFILVNGARVHMNDLFPECPRKRRDEKIIVPVPYFTSVRTDITVPEGIQADKAFSGILANRHFPDIGQAVQKGFHELRVFSGKEYLAVGIFFCEIGLFLIDLDIEIELIVFVKNGGLVTEIERIKDVSQFPGMAEGKHGKP